MLLGFSASINGRTYIKHREDAKTWKMNMSKLIFLSEECLCGGEEQEEEWTELLVKRTKITVRRDLIKENDFVLVLLSGWVWRTRLASGQTLQHLNSDMGHVWHHGLFCFLYLHPLLLVLLLFCLSSFLFETQLYYFMCNQKCWFCDCWMLLFSLSGVASINHITIQLQPAADLHCITTGNR